MDRVFAQVVIVENSQIAKHGNTMPNIFVSYRREESAYVASTVAEKLSDRFGRGSVFLDIDNIPIGVDFRQHLGAAISHAHIVLVIIGDKWISCQGEDGRRRIDNATDFVRIEIESALSLGIPVAPVLIGNAKMPREDELPEAIRSFAFRNATELRPGKEFLGQLENLVESCSMYDKRIDSTIPTARMRTTERITPLTNRPPAPAPATGLGLTNVVKQLLWLHKPKRVLSQVFQIIFFAGAFFVFLLSLLVIVGTLAPPSSSKPESASSNTSPFVMLLLVLYPWILLYAFVWFPGKMIDWLSPVDNQSANSGSRRG